MKKLIATVCAGVALCAMTSCAGTPEEVKVELNNGMLSISGEKKQEESGKDASQHVQERCYGSFSRSMSLPEDADVVQIWSAALKIRIKGSPVPLKNGYQLVKQCKPSSFGTVGYLISREAAQRALEGSQRINCPVDYYLFSPWFPFVRKNQVFRLSIRPLALTSAPSEIGLRKKRQFKRPLLRQLNPVRWFGQIRISFGKMFSTPFEVKEGTFHR